jgi:hypothetical protein
MSDQVSRRARQLALDPDISDYEFWRTLKSVRHEIYRLLRAGRPVPIRLLYARKTLEMAIVRRGGVP